MLKYLLYNTNTNMAEEYIKLNNLSTQLCDDSDDIKYECSICYRKYNSYIEINEHMKLCIKYKYSLRYCVLCGKFAHFGIYCYNKQ